MTSLKRVPRLYHCTKPPRLDSILVGGLDPSCSPDNLVYMSTTCDGAFGFMRNRAHDFIGDIEIDVEGVGKVTFPEIVQYTTLYVIEIDAEKLDWTYMQYGRDHNPKYFTDPVYTYDDIIPPEAFVAVWEYNVNSEECHIRFPGIEEA